MTGGRTLFYWSEQTAAKPGDTGIERVVRCLGRALCDLGVEVVPVGWDGERRLLRALTDAEHDLLRIGTVARAVAARPGDWLLVPEFPARAIGEGADPIALGRAYGLRTAVLVHDLIPLKLRSLYPPAALAFYGRCFRAFAGADHLVATTRSVAEDLAVRLPPPTRGTRDLSICALAAQLPGEPRRGLKLPLPDAPLRLLTVSRWEPRKNLPRLLGALERLAGRPDLAPIQLTIVGRRGGFPAYEAEVEAQLARLPNATVLSDVDDRRLVALHETHHATVYPSYEEGFGLPILESLWLATPCVCHAGSAMAEIAPGGGTLLVDMRDEAAIAAAVADLAGARGWLRRLSEEAVARPLRTWTDTARDVAASLGLDPPSRSGADKSLLDLAGVFC